VNRGLLALFRTLVLSLPALFNVSVVLLINFYIFSVIGMVLFSGTRYSAAAFGAQSPAAGSGSYGPNANFESFWVSAITLFRCSTGEDWNGIMHSLRIQPPYCSGENCGDRHIPVVYFFLFQMITAMILLSLGVAVVMDTFDDIMGMEKESQNTFVVTPDTLATYEDCWSAVDPRASKYIYFQQLIKLMSLLPHPLGAKGAPDLENLSPRASALTVIAQLNLTAPPTRKFHFHLVLKAVVSRALRASKDSSPTASPPMSPSVSGKSEYTMTHSVAAARIQHMILKRAGSKKVRTLLEAVLALKKAQVKPSAVPLSLQTPPKDTPK